MEHDDTISDLGNVLQVRAEPRDKGGRPKGFDGTTSKQQSALSQAFKRAGLDWREDFALAIKGANDPRLSRLQHAQARERIKLWLKLLPYMITTSRKAKVRKWKGPPSKAARIALEAMEQETARRPI